MVCQRHRAVGKSNRTCAVCWRMRSAATSRAASSGLAPPTSQAGMAGTGSGGPLVQARPTAHLRWENLRAFQPNTAEAMEEQPKALEKASEKAKKRLEELQAPEEEEPLGGRPRPHPPPVPPHPPPVTAPSSGGREFPRVENRSGSWRWWTAPGGARERAQRCVAGGTVGAEEWSTPAQGAAAKSKSRFAVKTERAPEETGGRSEG